jgi:hypothetical protein
VAVATGPPSVAANQKAAPASATPEVRNGRSDTGMANLLLEIAIVGPQSLFVADAKFAKSRMNNGDFREALEMDV